MLSKITRIKGGASQYRAVSFMAYTVNLNNNQQLTIVNQGTQTVITLVSSSPGQQQSQSSSFTTGSWNAIPQLYKTGGGFTLQVNGDRGQLFVSIQANSLNAIASPGLDNAVKVDLEDIPDSAAKQNNAEFEPMQPMKMGNMSMSMNPMSMQMGNMSMTMGTGTTSTSTKRFCSQCGQEAKQSDRFCSSCGHQLDN